MGRALGKTGTGQQGGTLATPKSAASRAASDMPDKAPRTAEKRSATSLPGQVMQAAAHGSPCMRVRWLAWMGLLRVGERHARACCASGMRGLARARNAAYSGAAARHALFRVRAEPVRTTCSRVDEHLCQPGSARGWLA